VTERETNWGVVVAILCALVIAGVIYVMTLPPQPAYSVPSGGQGCVPSCYWAYDR
jgi:hypothetical protein